MKNTTFTLVSIIATLAIILNHNHISAQGNGNSNNDKIEICHYPPGNPYNPQRITISRDALEAHLAHGDNVGYCNHIEKIEFFKFGANPNPFNEVLNVEVELLEECFVSVELYNQQGSNIHTILKEKIRKGHSSHSINLRELGFTSGIYLLKATAINETEFLEQSLIVVESGL